MTIPIAVRYRPFSHELGATCLIPRTGWVVEAFPALLRFRSLETEESFTVPLDVQGPLREFTLEQDLEKGCVTVFGAGAQGRFSLQISATPTEFCFSFKKGQSFSRPFSGSYHAGMACERLSLGSHRSQDWELVLRRFDLRDILPVLYQASQWIPEREGSIPRIASLLERGFEVFLRGAFSKLLCPRLMDDQYQGIFSSEVPSSEESPLSLLTIAKRAIRRLFIEEEQGCVSLRTSPLFHCGRFVGLQLSGIGVMDVEWSKGSLRRAVLHTTQETNMRLDLTQAKASSFRCRTSLHEKGRRLQSQEPWNVAAHSTHYLDRFQT